MKRLFIATFCVASAILSAARATAADGNWKLVWSDEFTGTSLDPNKWSCDEGAGFYVGRNKQLIRGWGNNELECYTNRPDNVYVSDGMLHIRAVKESYHDSQYTSAKLLTRNHFSKLYGRFEFKAKLPVGKGMWPALWLLPADKTYGNWPASGEIDITEARGQQPSKVLGTLHFGSTGGGHDWQEDDFTFPDNQTINDFHVYALDWNAESAEMPVDGLVYNTFQNPHTDWQDWPFDQNMQLIMNFALGSYGGAIDDSVFPQKFLIDYVRIYQ